MIQDADDTVRDALLQASICIVGGGPAGITLARELAATGRSILLVESGGRAPDDAANELNAGEVVDETLHSPADTYRQRCLGGATSIWGGRCVPFDPIDFQERPWIEHSGWPVSFAEIERFYPAANALCEAGAYEYDGRLATPGGMRPVLRGFAPEHFDVNGIERFSCPTDFGRRYGPALEGTTNVRVLLHATVTKLRCSRDGNRIERLDLRNSHGTAFSIEADQVVLATGGMETPRLLLLSDDVHVNGIGNRNDLVGRFYMSHIAGTVGQLRINGSRDSVWHGYDIAPDGTYCRRRLALRPACQERMGTGNIVFRLHHPRITDPAHRTGPLSSIYLAQKFIRYEYAKRLAGDVQATRLPWLRHFVNTATDPISTVKFLMHWLRDRTLADRKFPSVIIHPRTNLFSLDFHAEQLPNPSSRIGLGSGTDRFGNRQIRVDWHYTPQDVHTVSRAFQLLRDDLAAGGTGTLDLAPGEEDISAVVRRDGAYGGHHIGTARMGASAASGVVDGNCKVFGVNNLYLAGSAVFPTSGQANPTLTIVAMALRLAEHLRHDHEQVVTASTQPRMVEVA